ncbi:hypothetical protein SBRY_60229 [Actinacidiphila bryophytorum]|uniref:Uncharacterized protein n=1 Tax=Actinacidiphila bryophytorum TaxID=1436133 RepID=A0A9W4MEQ7_9ACTN|nr:hypothetical protein SBRY_60229 [Actinacidiphila bryophytorum]
MTLLSRRTHRRAGTRDGLSVPGYSGPEHPALWGHDTDREL